MSERDGYEPGAPCWVAAVEPDPGTVDGQITLWRVPGCVGDEPQVVLADPQGAAFTVSQLAIASQGA